jgi:hypothetical protein
MAYYSIMCTTLESQCAEGQKSSFVNMQLKFIQLEECHSSNGSTHCTRANLAALNQNPLAAANHHNGRLKAKGDSKTGNNK